MPEPIPPLAERRPVQLTTFGDSRTDEYGWLRDKDDPGVLAYLRAENAYAAHVLGRHAELQRRVYDEIVAAIEETDVTAPVRFGGFFYYERTFEGRNYPVHCRRPALGTAYPDVSVGDEQVVLDENAIAEGHEFCEVGVLEVSPDHRRCAVGVDYEGSERYDVRFAALDGGTAPPEVLEGVGGDGVAWTADSTAVCYLRMDAAWRPCELWHHVLGTDPDDDRLLLREDDDRFRISVGRSRDDEVLVVHVASITTSEVRVAPANDPGSLRVLWPRRQGVEVEVDHLRGRSVGGGFFVGTTNDGGARDFKVVASPEQGDAAFFDVVAPLDGRRITRTDAFAGHLVVSFRHGGETRVRVCPLREGPEPFAGDLFERGWDVEADETPSVTALGPNPEYDVASLRVVQTSMITPPSDLDVELVSRSRIVRKRKPVRGYDRERYSTRRLWVSVRDGTSVPVSLVYRNDDRGTPGHGDPSEPRPMLLYGYGAYEICIDPVFSSSRLPLLDRGVTFAIAHVRGGGELGRRWYEGGRLERKATTFHDFVDVARGLCELGYTTPERLCAQGGSAGGLLIGAAINEDPSAFRAAVAEVPFVDVLNTISDPTLPLTVSEWEEWGDPVHSEDDYRSIKSWSPYDNVVGVEPDGTSRRYPDLLVLGSLNDTRVSYWEPAKWVARLRAANAENRVVFKTELGAGHAGPSGRYDAWRERALVYAFVLEELGAVT